jgi:hypothetical protein
MSELAPHLLLFADSGASHAAMLLRTAGYMISKVDLADAERTACAPDVDGIVVQLPAIPAIAVVRRIESYRRDTGIVVITTESETVKRVLPSAHVIQLDDLDDDLVSMVDLALAAQQMRRTG